ncbi:hypothetical protein ACFL47_06820 [Candidatus Latescibacterota bacterium]
MVFRRFILIAALCCFALIATSVFADFNMGGKVVIKSDDSVSEAVSLGEDVHVYGTVRGDAVAIGGDVYVESGGEVRGNAVAIAGNVSVKNEGRIKHDAVSIGGVIRVDQGGSISGEEVSLARIPFFFNDRDGCGLNTGGFNPGKIFGNIGKIFLFGPFAGVVSMVGVLIITAFLMIKLLVRCGIAALIVYLAPRHVNNMSECVRVSPLKSFLVGLVTLFIIPFLTLLLLVTIVGIPLVPIVGLILFLAYVFGAVGISLWAGQFLPMSEHRSNMHNTLLGVLVIGLVRFIPIIGVIVGFIAGILAVGTVVITRFGADGCSQS